MAVETKLEEALRNNRLWPSVHDALDTYVRRRAAGADGYERVWRLIHLWESIAITTGAVVASAVRDRAELKDHYRRVREHLWGMSWDNLEEDFAPKVPGALDGSIDKWLAILRVGSEITESAPMYLKRIGLTLSTRIVDVSPLLHVWKRVCDHRAVAQPNQCRLLEVMALVNSFRNRFAHVPFPHAPISEFAQAFERLTASALDGQGAKGGEGFVPEAHNPADGGWLCGGFRLRGRLFRGGGHSASVGGTAPAAFVVQEVNPREEEVYPADEFLHSDEMLTPHVLTRLLDREVGQVEYTRFKAEAQAVVTAYRLRFGDHLPPPAPDDYPRPVISPQVTAPAPAAIELNVPEVQVVQTPPTKSATVPVAPETLASTHPVASVSPLVEAKLQIRNSNFDRAIEILEQLVNDEPNYHVGWTWLGRALRERAARRADKELALQDLRRSEDALTQGRRHVSEEWRAETDYQKSKTLHRRWIVEDRKDPNLIEAARQRAIEAAKVLNYDYVLSWCDYLARTSPTSE